MAPVSALIVSADRGWPPAENGVEIRVCGIRAEAVMERTRAVLRDRFAPIATVDEPAASPA